MNKQSGQAAIEYIIITAVLALISVGVYNYLNTSQSFQSLVQNPLDLVQGMVENGSWGDLKKTKATHPNLKERHVSLLPR